MKHKPRTDYERLEVELRLSMKGVSPLEGLSIDEFIMGIMSLIDKGRATWDGTNIHLIESGRQ